MIKKTRESKILELLNLQGSIEVKDLVANFKISENTARRDLKSIEEQGLLVRTHGGAMVVKQQYGFMNFDSRLGKDKVVKEKLSKVAASYINENDVVFIDGGTTLYYLYKYLRNKNNIIVITHSLPLIYQLSNSQGIKLILIGGEVDFGRKLTSGSIAEKNVNEYHANKAFIGADGVSLKKGISSFESKEADITRNMILNCDKIFLVCTSDKIEKEAFIRVDPFEKIHCIITDSNLDEEIAKAYKEKIDIQLVS
jgi:DeoR family fructose operon transcriptional repressor